MKRCVPIEQLVRLHISMLKTVLGIKVQRVYLLLLIMRTEVDICYHHLPEDNMSGA